MRYFKLVGTDSYTYYNEGKTRTYKKGQVLKTGFPPEAEKFEKNNLFMECDERGVIGAYAQAVPDEAITSRTVYTYNRDGKLTRK